MTLKTDLESEVATIFRSAWKERDGTVVPTDDSVTLGNDGINISATVLYADLNGSTQLVDSSSRQFAAEIYKTYLHCTAKIIRSENGVITAYDGDRIMAVYIGDYKNTRAARTGLKINFAVRNIINPAMLKIYKDKTYRVRQIVGVDTSPLLVAKTGVRGANDLVWVGSAANHAAKLSELSEGDYVTWISKAVYDALDSSLKIVDGKAVWETRNWTTMNNKKIYRSNWWSSFE